MIHLAEDGRDELYDRASDPGESANLADGRPALARQPRRRLLEELKACGARLAVRNP